MGACKAQVFDTMHGGRVIYVKVPRKEETNRKLEQIIDLLSALASSSYDAFGKFVQVDKREKMVSEMQSIIVTHLKDIYGANLANL